MVTLASDDAALAKSVLGGITGVTGVQHTGRQDDFHTFRLQLDGARHIGEDVARAVHERGWALRELRRDDKTLEQVFRELTAARREVAA